MAEVLVKDCLGAEFRFPEAHFRTDEVGVLQVFVDPSEPFAEFSSGQWIGVIRHE